MDTTMVLHFEGTDLWWAELADVPGFSASAGTLLELRAIVEACLADLSADVGEEVRIIRELLAEASPPAPPAPPAKPTAAKVEDTGDTFMAEAAA